MISFSPQEGVSNALTLTMRVGPAPHGNETGLSLRQDGLEQGFRSATVGLRLPVRGAGGASVIEVRFMTPGTGTRPIRLTGNAVLSVLMVHPASARRPQGTCG